MTTFLRSLVAFAFLTSAALAQVGPGGGGNGSGSGNYTGATATSPGTSGPTATPVQGVAGGVPIPISGSITASLGAFAPSGQNNITATTTSAATALASAGPTALVSNTGTSIVYVNFGGSTVTATNASYPVAPGQQLGFNVGTNTYIATLAASGTDAVSVTLGTGLPAIGNATVTDNQGAPASIANAWPFFLTQGGAILSGTNGLPTTDTNASQTISSAGTSGAKAQTIQGVAGGVPVIATANQGTANAGGAAAWPVLLDPAAANAVSQGAGSATPANGWHTIADGSTSSGGIALVARLPSSAATNNATPVKGSATRLYKIKGTNTTASPIRVKIYNKATAPAPATDTPLDVCVLPANATASCDMMDIGWFLSAGFGYATVTGAADNDNTAVAAGAVTDLSFGYK